ncbi:MAG: hypothetical protein ACI92G_000253 [Candidatus Pelagisphaera sp.]|jgi:hypothetical protein
MDTPPSPATEDYSPNAPSEKAKNVDSIGISYQVIQIIEVRPKNSSIEFVHKFSLSRL